MDSRFLLPIVLRLLVALLVGGFIGWERTYHGRPAGFRTHSLVCISSALLMALAVFQRDLVSQGSLEHLNIDPMRVAQGIMTGIGFLGAGVIVKEKLTVRGLTTAASIWTTSAIGIVIGAGLYLTALIATVVTIGTLAFFRRIEQFLPSLYYASLTVGFLKGEALVEEEVIRVVAAQGISNGSASYQLTERGNVIQYQMSLQTDNPANFRKLSNELRAIEEVHEFSLLLASR